MAAEEKSRLELLERTVLELGAEMFALKRKVDEGQDSYEKLLAVLNGLKQLLDEKGLITLEDFESAIELGEAIEHFNQVYEVGDDFEKMKKTGH